MKFATLHIRKMRKAMIQKNPSRFPYREGILSERSKYGIFHVRPYGGGWRYAGG